MYELVFLLASNQTIFTWCLLMPYLPVSLSLKTLCLIQCFIVLSILLLSSLE